MGQLKLAALLTLSTILSSCTLLPLSVQTWIKDKGQVACAAIPGQIQSAEAVKALFVAKGDTKAAGDVQKAIDALKSGEDQCKKQGLL